MLFREVGHYWPEEYKRGGNKLVQYVNGQWDPSKIDNVGDVANLALDIGLDFVTPAAGANLGEAIVKNTGWFTSITASGQFVQVGEHITSGFKFSGVVEVTSKRIGTDAAKGGMRILSNLSKKNIDDFLNEGARIDRNGLTKAGRALQKHGSRSGSVFPKVSGKMLNSRGQSILNEILHSPNKIVRPNRFGGLDIFDKITGRGVRYDAEGLFKGFLEP